MNTEFYKKLVDLYAGDELPEELVDELKQAAGADPTIAQDMDSLKQTVQALHDNPTDGMTEICYQRVLRRILDEAGLPEKRVAPQHQYRFKFGS